MAKAKSKGSYVPLAAQYFMDDAVLEAGPDAELLFIRILSFLASIPSDGFITVRQVGIAAGGLRAPQKRLESLLKVGLIEQVSGGFLVRSWLKWNRSADEVGKLLAKDRERKSRNHAEEPQNSGRNPNGIRTDSSPQYRAVQNSTEQSTPSGVDSRAHARTRATRLPPTWTPTPQHANYAKQHHLDLNHETEQFRNHAQANDRRQHDWNAAFRTWLGNTKKWAQPKHHPQTYAQQRETNTLAIVHHYEQQEQHAEITNSETPSIHTIN